MFREILEVVMLLALVGGAFFIKYAFDKDKQESKESSKPPEKDE